MNLKVTYDNGLGVSLELNGETKVGTLFLKNIEKRNVLGSEMQQELISFLNIVKESSTPFSKRIPQIQEQNTSLDSQSAIQSGKPLPWIRVLIITTPDKNQTWCSGMDLNQKNQLKLRNLLKTPSSTSDEKSVEDSNIGIQNNQWSKIENVIRNEFLQVFEAVYSCTIPTIAFIRGPVLGGGLGLMLSCDYIIVDEECNNNVFFQFSEVKRGLVPALISLYIVPRIGTTISNRLMMSGKRISSQEALKLGLIHYIGDNKLIDEIISHIREAGPNAISLTKKLVKSYDKIDPSLFKTVLETFQEMMLNDEAKYGISCFLKKQTPNWDEFYNGIKSKL